MKLVKNFLFSLMACLIGITTKAQLTSWPDKLVNQMQQQYQKAETLFDKQNLPNQQVLSFRFSWSR